MSKPPILNYAVPQRKDEGIIYNYDESLSLNVIITEKGKTKFIDLAECSIEFATKTDIARERDDVGEIGDNRLEFATKTEMERERDDESLEFVTKTAIKREGDDDIPYSLKEFSTKTRIERESDDDTAYNLLEFVTKTNVVRESDDQ